MEVTGSGSASCPRPRSPQADSMVLFGAFCNFCVQKKKKKLFQNDLNECIFVYVHESEAIRTCDPGRLLCWKRRESLCVWWPSMSFSFGFFFVFHFFLIFTFLLSLLHHNKTFSTNIHREPIVRKSSCRCNDEAKPFACTALRSMALASVRPADTVLLFAPTSPPPVNLLSFNCT